MSCGNFMFYLFPRHAANNIFLSKIKKMHKRLHQQHPLLFKRIWPRISLAPGGLALEAFLEGEAAVQVGGLFHLAQVRPILKAGRDTYAISKTRRRVAG